MSEAIELKLRGGTTAENAAFTGASKEVSVDTDKNTLIVHDGTTAGGHPLAPESASTAQGTSYNDTASGIAADNVQDAIDEVAGDLVNFEETFSGAVQFFARNTAPTGWLKANGAAISRTTFSALFDAIGTTFGSGDGSTTFNLPDMRGEFPRGWDDGRGVDSGRDFGTEQGDEFRSHNHAPYRGRSISNGTQNRSWVVGGSEGAIINNISSSISNAGGSETRPRNIALLACIKF